MVGQNFAAARSNFAAASSADPTALTDPVSPTEDPYKSTIMRFQVRAPRANWTDDLNDTESDSFAFKQSEVQTGVSDSSQCWAHSPENAFCLGARVENWKSFRQKT